MIFFKSGSLNHYRNNDNDNDNDNDNEYHFIHKYIQWGLQSELDYIIVMMLFLYVWRVETILEVKTTLEII